MTAAIPVTCVTVAVHAPDQSASMSAGATETEEVRPVPPLNAVPLGESTRTRTVARPARPVIVAVTVTDAPGRTSKFSLCEAPRPSEGLTSIDEEGGVTIWTPEICAVTFSTGSVPWSVTLTHIQNAVDCALPGSYWSSLTSSGSSAAAVPATT